MSVSTAPSREDFASLLAESFAKTDLAEGSVIKGKVTAIEKDLAVIDVGLKTEGRIALKEFTGPDKVLSIKVGDTVEVYLERVENALGEPSSAVTRPAAKRAGSISKRPSRPMRRSTARSSTRSRAATRSILMARPPSCPVRRWTSVRSAMSAR